jgi:hypothetical protein
MGEPGATPNFHCCLGLRQMEEKYLFPSLWYEEGFKNNL